MTITLLQPDGVPISATAFRQGQAATHGGGANRPLGGRSGFRVDTAADVLTVTTTTWTLKPCSAMIDPNASTHQGMYGWASDANITGSPTPPDATLPRKDIYYIQVNDSTSGDGSGAMNADVYYLAGTPSAATPLPAPALPARSFLIATVTVPQNGGGNPTVVLNPARFAAAGGVLPITSTEQAALSKYSGLTTSRNGILEVTDGTNWNRAGVKVIPTAESQVGASLPTTAFTSGDFLPITQVGTKVVTTDASGYFSIDYPQAFPNGVLAATFTNGDSAQGRDMIIATAGSPFTQTKATSFGSVVDSAGNAKASATIRVNFVVWGW